MKLVTLSLSNFRGMKEFLLSPNGEDLAIYGDNGTGKTTVADAFWWLLFNKDFSGRSDFPIAPLDEKGRPIHKLVTQVSAVVQVGDTHVGLRKNYVEKWVKKKGRAQETLEGHTAEYFIDLAPVSKMEYDSRISSWVGEEEFKLLTNVRYFNELLDWKGRRLRVMKLGRELSDAEVIASDGEFLPFGNMKITVEQEMKRIESDMKGINKELNELPARIDEAKAAPPVPVDRTALLIPEIEAHIAAFLADADGHRARLKGEQEARQALAVEWQKTKDSVCPPVDVRLCDKCGNPLSPDQIAAYRESVDRLFNEAKKQRLADIVTMGNAATARIKEREESITRCGLYQSQAEERLRTLRGKVAEPPPPPPNNENRVKELENRQSSLGKQYEDLEARKVICQRFMAAKAKMQAGEVNKHFPTVTFKLFDMQLNGLLADTCEVMVGGVPYSGLSNGERINAGLEVIDVFSGIMGKTAPIFIDNAEAVTDIRETAAQQIKLVVSQPDKTLRVVQE